MRDTRTSSHAQRVELRNHRSVIFGNAAVVARRVARSIKRESTTAFARAGAERHLE